MEGSGGSTDPGLRTDPGKQEPAAWPPGEGVGKFGAGAPSTGQKGRSVRATVASSSAQRRAPPCPLPLSVLQPPTLT